MKRERIRLAPAVCSIPAARPLVGADREGESPHHETRDRSHRHDAKSGQAALGQAFGVTVMTEPLVLRVREGRGFRSGKLPFSF
jgi:hypothetical protein